MLEQLQAIAFALGVENTPDVPSRISLNERKGNGLKLFKHAGRYQLRISSTLARWTLKIKQIKPEEEELYTPRGEKSRAF